ncbi:MAG: phage tail tube protein [Paraclostridium sp.]
MPTITKLSGIGGAVKIATVKVAGIDNWKLSVKGNLVETTSFDSNGWEEYIATTKGWEASFEGVLTQGDTTGQEVLLKAMIDGTSVSISLDKSATNSYTGSVLIESVEVDTSVKDKIKLSIKAKGNGALTGFGVTA